MPPRANPAPAMPDILDLIFVCGTMNLLNFGWFLARISHFWIETPEMLWFEAKKSKKRVDLRGEFVEKNWIFGVFLNLCDSYELIRWRWLQRGSKSIPRSRWLGPWGAFLCKSGQFWKRGRDSSNRPERPNKRSSSSQSYQSGTRSRSILKCLARNRAFCRNLEFCSFRKLGHIFGSRSHTGSWF